MSNHIPTNTLHCKTLKIAIAAMSIQAGLLIHLSWSTSPNYTELGHVAGALHFWNTGKHDVFHVNPPLLRIISGMPVAVFCQPKTNWDSYSTYPQDRCEWALGAAFVRANDYSDIRNYFFLMRVVCIPLILLGSYYGYRFAHELYGGPAAIIFIILWTFSPLILGWGATICPDVAAASMGVVGVYTFWTWLNKPSWKNAIIAGIFLGFMPLTKITWVFAFPIWAILFGVWKYFEQKEKRTLPWNQFWAILFLAVYVINAGYFYDGSFRPLKDYCFISTALSGNEAVDGKPTESGNRFKNTLIGFLPVPFPAEFIQGIDTQKLDFEKGMDSYACGDWSDHGWWWYYCYVLMLREPLATWCLTLLACLSVLSTPKRTDKRKNELIIVIPLVLLFVFISKQDGFSAHPRYILLVSPFLYLFISRLGMFLAKKRPIIIATISICLLWFAISSISFYPYFLSYFNTMGGKPENWPMLLLGSNINWGQETYETAAWVKKHPHVKPLYISIKPTIPLEKFGITHEEVPIDETRGFIVICVNYLYSRDNRYAWLRKYQPKQIIGHSIYVYELRE